MNKKGNSKKKPESGAGSRIAAYRNSFFYRVIYGKGILYFILSFLIPAVIMTLAFRNNEIHPFGDEQMLVVDLWHQYYPFFRVVREKLLDGGSFLYSWFNGLGTNFLSLISYYAASPLNWMSVLFDEEHVRDALTFILITKIGFCGAFFSCFLRYTFGRKDISICFFSAMFALCSYMLGYYWNVMWFDTIALFPLVMLGVTAICREGKWKTFTFSLALSLIANYYIGYFTCIFTVFMFAAMIIINFRGLKDLFRKLWITARSSVLGIALGGFILLPAYYGLQLTNSVNNTFPKEVTWYESWTKIFANTISYSEPAMKEGLPNFACGMLAIVLLGVFLFSTGIKIREKIAVVSGLAIIAVSCNMNILNYIWHGFHFTNMIPYRFAFIFSFILIAAAYRAYDIILQNGVKIYQIVLMTVFPWVVCYLNYAIRKEDADFGTEGALKKSIIIAGVFILIFIAVKIFPFTNTKIRNSVLSVFLGVALVGELSANATLGVKTVGSSDYTGYPSYYDDVEKLLDDADNADDSPFYRTEVTKTYTLNDSALYGYYGLSQFSSAANVSVTTFCKRLGLYASEAGNRYYYRLSTPVVNSMMGIKYLISKTGYQRGEKMALSEFSKAKTSVMYVNNYPLSLGYMVDPAILELKDDAYGNPFAYQNELLKLSSGISQDCFTPQPVALASYDGMEVTKRAYGDYSFTKTNGKNSDASSTYDYNGIDGSYLYGYASNGGCNGVDVFNETESVDSGIEIESYPIVFPMGGSQSGETVSVKMKADPEKDSGTFKLMVYALDKNIWEQAYANLADEQLDIKQFDDTKITGTVNALKDGIMFFSIPYENGWTVRIDGQEVETVKLAGAMLGAEVPAGEHEISLSYIPEGFVAGTTATGVSTVLCVTLMCLDRRKKNRPAPETDDPDGSGESDEKDTVTENPEPEAAEKSDEKPSKKGAKKSSGKKKNEKS